MTTINEITKDFLNGLKGRYEIIAINYDIQKLFEQIKVIDEEAILKDDKDIHFTSDSIHYSLRKHDEGKYRLTITGR